MDTLDIGNAVEVRLVGFLSRDNNPHRALVHGLVVADSAELGILGRDVIVTMEDTGLQGNRIIQDLINGTHEHGVAKCVTGAVVEFRGCELLNDDEISARILGVVDDGTDAEVDLDDLPALREGFEVAMPTSGPAPR